MAAAFKVACVQMTASRDMAANLAAAADWGRKARAAGAELICYPENVAIMEPQSQALYDGAKTEAEHPGTATFAALARELGVWILGGTLALRRHGAGESDGDDRLVNRSLLFAPDGTVTARYDKIHMFDVEVGDGQTYRESAKIKPGEAAVIADLPWGGLGMTVCYDVRFPYLYRALAHGGALFLSVPAAFTKLTGEAHWHVLLRARAIENGAYVFAPAQCGTHAENRQTFGHGLIVDPWGRVLADAGDEPGFILATVDPAEALAARAKIPALTHDRHFIGP